MAERFTEMIKAFDGSSGDVACWLKKVKLVVKLKKAGDLANFIPLYLEGSAFEVYDQMDEDDKGDAAKIEETLLNAFAQSSFGAYETFRQRSWMVGEAVDVFLADLRRLARLAKVENDILLLRAFVVGLPLAVSSRIQATPDVDSMGLVKVLQLARVLIANRDDGVGLVSAVAGAKFGNDGVGLKSSTTSPKNQNLECFRCGGRGHISKFCRSKTRSSRTVSPDTTCFKCGEKGHISWTCTVKDSGKLDAPAASQEI